MALSKYGKRIGAAAHAERLEQDEYIRGLAGYVHPREIKLEKLRGLMGAEQYQVWYEVNQFTFPVRRWEALIDQAISSRLEAELVRGRYACHPSCPLLRPHERGILSEIVGLGQFGPM